MTSGVHSPPAPPAQTGCPTVTVTGVLCATCPVPACLGLATATQRCGCPEAIPTVTLDFPCEDNCKGIFCTTSWDYVTEECDPTGTATDDDPTAEPTVSATDPGTEDPSGPGPTDGPSGTGTGTGEEPPVPTTSFAPAAAGKIAPMLAAPFAALLLL
jgi:hypothetical protein